MTVEWVPGDWDKVRIGDSIKLVMPGTENVLSGSLLEAWPHRLGFASIKISGLGKWSFSPQLWSLFVEAPPKVQLPTGDFTVIQFETGGAWMLGELSRYWWKSVPAGVPQPLGVHVDAMPRGEFTVKSAPPAQTAKKVLDRVETYLMYSPGSAALNDLRREFGVTNV
jgi:hypothetical protein